MPQGEYEPRPDITTATVGEQLKRRIGDACARLEQLMRPTREKTGRRDHDRIKKIWQRHGRMGFMDFGSTEGARSTPEQVRGLHPADSLPEEPKE